jgi:antirestriction protein ArdC
MSSSSSSSAHADVHARVTAAIISAIEAGTGTWRMPWHHSGADVTRPTNVASGKPYRGINTVSLWAAAYASGYTSGVWGTYRQWQALGAQVRKGEQASLGVLWKELRAKDDDDGNSDEHEHDHRRLFAKAFSLFNADQVDGYVPEPQPILPESERLVAVEAFIAALGIDTVYGAPSAYYDIAQDRIYMPGFSTFHDAHGFYATQLHEAAHASGAAHRLDRNFSARWTKHALAMEEATAELTASFLLADLGIAHEPRADHAAYIASWLQLLKDEPRAIFTAASKAQAAADWMPAQQP